MYGNLFDGATSKRNTYTNDFMIPHNLPHAVYYKCYNHEREHDSKHRIDDVHVFRIVLLVLFLFCGRIVKIGGKLSSINHHSLNIYQGLRPTGTGNSRCHCTPYPRRCMFDPRNRTRLCRIRLLLRGVCVKIIKMGEIKHRKMAVNPERQKIGYPPLEPLSLKAVYKIANDELIATASAKYRICTTFVFD